MLASVGGDCYLESDISDMTIFGQYMTRHVTLYGKVITALYTMSDVQVLYYVLIRKILYPIYSGYVL